MINDVARINVVDHVTSGDHIDGLLCTSTSPEENSSKDGVNEPLASHLCLSQLGYSLEHL